MRNSKPKIIILFVAVFAMLAVGFVVSSEPLQAGEDVEIEPTDDTVLFGVSTPPGPHDLTELEAFEQAAGEAPGLYMYYRGFAYDGFEVEYAQAAVDRGSIPMITWEPWDYLNGVEQPTYSLRTIIDGHHDAYILDFAGDAAGWGGPLLLRFAHEMNASTYPWSEQTNGNQPGEYAQAWQHVHDLFASVGATNVEWVWSPNVSYDGTTPLEGLYPGDAYVDWVAADGYNGGTELPWGGWLTFDEIFSSTLDELRTIAPTKPVLIGEMASVEGGGDKAQWIRDFFSSLEARPYIKAFVWFNHDKEADWRIQSSSEATSAFADGVADPQAKDPSDCGDIVTGTVTLTEPLGPCPSHGLLIGAPNTQIDLGGHPITGSGVGMGIGVAPGADATGAVVRGSGVVQGFGNGIALTGTDIVLRDLLVRNNASRGVLLDVHRATLDRVRSTNNGSDGVFVRASGRVTVVDSVAKRNGGKGISVDAAVPVLRRVVTRGNAQMGILAKADKRAVVRDSKVLANARHGVLVKAPASAIFDNVARNNRLLGIAPPDRVSTKGGDNTAVGNNSGGRQCRPDRIC